MRTTPPCVLESVSVMPFTERLNTGRIAFHAISVPFEELLSASDDEDAIMLEELTSSPRELEEFEAISELLLDSISDELDSASELLDSTGVELDDSSLELLDNPYFE